MNYGYTTIVGDFASPEWPIFIRDLERAVADGRVAPNGAAAERERARRRIEQERASERLAWIATERARIDAEKAKPTFRERLAGMFR